jgi:heterotetrameric sarcosine oxidase gamma subunit
MTSHDNHCRIDRSAGASMYEFVSYSGSVQNPTGGDWPSAPGAVRFDEQFRPLLAHFAPGRWLAPEPSPQTLAFLNDAAGSGAGTLVDVTGKWDAIRICGPGSVRLLACTINCEVMLENRDCAAATLFDCPAILMRTSDGFSAWVQSSYTGHFLATAEQFRTALETAD